MGCMHRLGQSQWRGHFAGVGRSFARHTSGGRFRGAGKEACSTPLSAATKSIGPTLYRLSDPQIISAFEAALTVNLAQR